MCKTKFLQMCSFSITLTSLHSLNLPFQLLSYFIFIAISFIAFFIVFTLILYIITMISCIFRISTQISDRDFKKIVTLVQKQTLSFVTTA